MNTRDLNRSFRYWQDFLGLLDWHIEVRVLRHFEIGSDVGGSTYVNRLREIAVVNIQDPRDLNPALIWIERDTEITLVHELLHVLIRGDEPDGGSSEEQERYIDRLARCLVMLRRTQQEV